LGYGEVLVSLNLGYKYSDFIKCGQFFDFLQKFTLLSDSAPWSILGNLLMLDPSLVIGLLYNIQSTTDLLQRNKYIILIFCKYIQSQYERS